jgi:hypothetical protein
MPALTMIGPDVSLTSRTVRMIDHFETSVGAV